MVNENNKYIPKAPETYIVAELRDQETKITPLSTAQSKVVRKWGGGYRSSQAEIDISETVGYGPCTRSDCTHTFYLNLTIGYEGFWGANGYYFTEGGDNNNITGYTVYSVDQARNLRRKFGNGSIWVCNQVGAASNNTRRKNRQAIDALDSWIRVFENGQSVDETVNLGR